MRQRAATLERESNELRITIDQYNLNLEYMPRRNNVEKELYDQARRERDAMRQQKIQDEAAASQIRSQLPGPDRVRALDTEINETRDAFKAALRELRETTDAIDAVYADLGKNREATKALSQLRAKLGPSPEYQKLLKQTAQQGR
jgi:hypothetical protein